MFSNDGKRENTELSRCDRQWYYSISPILAELPSLLLKTVMTLVANTSYASYTSIVMASYMHSAYMVAFMANTSYASYTSIVMASYMHYAYMVAFMANTRHASYTCMAIG